MEPSVEIPAPGTDVAGGDDARRFGFGENWRRFLSLLSERRIEASEETLRNMLGSDRLDGRTVLDAGSGSGLSSLAARRLGARVVSFDYDPQSVECTAELRRRFFPDDPAWTVMQGSVLDRDFLDGLGRFDIVYSWGVLHHTGSMWQAIERCAERVRPGGLLYIAIYNDQGWISRYWTWVKRTYNGGVAGRLTMQALHLPYYLAFLAVKRTKGAGGELRRGMSPWHDHVDWLGGYPFEVARPELVFDFLRTKGWVLQRMTTCGGKGGCNEFVFRAPAD